MKSKSEKILVTGATGLVGSHLLVEMLRSGTGEIRAMYRNPAHREYTRKVLSYYFENPDREMERIHWTYADLTDLTTLETAVEAVDKIYHTAGLVSFARKDEERLFEINTRGTAYLVDLALKYGVKSFHHVSSIAVFGKKKGGAPTDEDTVWSGGKKEYAYARSKYAAESEVWRAHQEGLKVCIVNPGVIIGPGFWNKNTGAFFPMMHNKFPYYSEGVTGFVGVWDVVKALLAIDRAGKCGERYILVSENMSYKDLLTGIAGALHVPVPSKKVDPLRANLAWRLDALRSWLTGSPRMFTRHSARAALKVQRYSSEKFIRDFDMEFEPMRDVIRRTAEYYLRDKK